VKGISAVIATILLLLIVIAIVGFAFGFFQRIFTTTTQTTEAQVGTTIGQLQQVVRIDNVAGTQLFVRNGGSAAVNTGNITVYVGGSLTSCAFAPNPKTIAVGALDNCTLASSCTGQTVRVTTPGSEDTKLCG
jgi:flagellin-like protein